MLLFLFKFGLTNLLFSIILCSFFIRINSDHKHSNLELLLYSLGLGPVFTTLLLYYSFLLIPHRSNLFYFISILTIYVLIAIAGRNSFKPLCREINDTIKKLFYVFNKPIYSQISFLLFLSLIFFPLALYLSVYFTKILPLPIIGHDILGYGTAGKMLFAEKSLTPIWTRDFSSSGFVYGILHAPSFSLLLTWEELVNCFFHLKSDLCFKSISSYYGFLILGTQFYLISKKNKWVALLGFLALLSGLAFFISFFAKHLDTYRILFFGLSLIYLVHSIKKKDVLSLVMLGIFSGFTAFAHRMGVVLACINLITFFIFFQGNFKDRVLKTVLVITLILAFGGSHYIFDIIWGQGDWLRMK